MHFLHTRRSVSLLLCGIFSVVFTPNINAWLWGSETKKQCGHTINVACLPQRIGNDDEYDLIKLLVEMHIPNCRELYRAQLDMAEKKLDTTFDELSEAHKGMLCACKQGPEACEKARWKMLELLPRYGTQGKDLCCITKNGRNIDTKEAQAVAMIKAYEARGKEPDDDIEEETAEGMVPAMQSEAEEDQLTLLSEQTSE